MYTGGVAYTHFLSSVFTCPDQRVEALVFERSSRDSVDTTSGDSPFLWVPGELFVSPEAA